MDFDKPLPTDADELREMALAHEKEERDRQGQLEYATRQGWQKGIKSGLKRGRKRGIEQGRIASLARTIVRTLERRFPDSDLSAVKNALSEITDIDMLNSLIDSAFESSTWEDFCQNLP